MDDVLILFGSARSAGTTMEAVHKVFPNRHLNLADLGSLNITPYDYDHHNEGDDFLAVVQRMIDASAVLFATPVYWYTMSSPMKVFFDRFTDLLDNHRDMLAGLRGTPCYLLVSGAEQHMPEGFEIPFQRSCEYLGMSYRQAFYYCSFFPRGDTHGRERDAAARLFGQRVLNTAATPTGDE